MKAMSPATLADAAASSCAIVSTGGGAGGGGPESSDDEPQLASSITVTDAAASTFNRCRFFIASSYCPPGSGVVRYGKAAPNSASVITVPLSV